MQRNLREEKKIKNKKRRKRKKKKGAVWDALATLFTLS